MKERKARWFAAGASDFARSLPTLAVARGPEAPPIYCCPLCARPDHLRVFTEGAIEEQILTVDDVPPRHSGGRPLVLTCKDCNDRNGYTVDAAAAEVERGQAFLAGRGPAHVHLNAGEHRLGATLSWQDNGAGHFRLDPNRPETVDAFRSIVTGTEGPDRSFHVTYQIRDPEDRLARVSWLKSAYLAMFALFGYRYALNPALDVVRRQIQEPETEHIEACLIRLPTDLSFRECRAFSIHAPELPPCWGIQMGRFLVFLPGSSSGNLYSRIAVLRKEKGREFHYTAKDSVWPTQPLFSLARRFESREIHSAAGETQSTP